MRGFIVLQKYMYTRCFELRVSYMELLTAKVNIIVTTLIQNYNDVTVYRIIILFFLRSPSFSPKWFPAIITICFCLQSCGYKRPLYRTGHKMWVSFPVRPFFAIDDTVAEDIIFIGAYPPLRCSISTCPTLCHNYTGTAFPLISEVKRQQNTLKRSIMQCSSNISYIQSFYMYKTCRISYIHVLTNGHNYEHNSSRTAAR